VTAQTLQGDWISDAPLRFGKVAFKGIQFDSQEAVAYDRLSIDKVRMFATWSSSTVEGSTVRLTINGSLAGLKEGTRLNLAARFDEAGQLLLSHGGQTAAYRIYDLDAPAANPVASAPSAAPASQDPPASPDAAAPLSPQAREALRYARLVADVAGAAGSVGILADLCVEVHAELRGEIRPAYSEWQWRNRKAIDLVEVHLMALDHATRAGAASRARPLGEQIRATIHGGQPQLRSQLLQDRTRFAAFCTRYPAELRTTQHDIEVRNSVQMQALREVGR
jgi:hypothetical protein